MRMKPLAYALLGTALLSAPVWAQTSPSTGTTTPSPGTSAMPSGGMMDSTSWMAQPQSGQWRTSQLEGLAVYNANNERIGEINEMLVDSSGKIHAAVIGVGGFLGIGERDVAVPFGQLKFVNEPRANMAASTTAAPGTMATNPPATTMPNTTAAAPANPNAPVTTGATTTTPQAQANAAAARLAPDHAVLMVTMTKDQLKSAPEFKYTR